MALTQESVLSFLLEHGGKVKNSELLNSFRSQISCGDPAEKQHNRDLFKKLVNSVAVVKQIDEVKFVVVKKRYQDFVKEVAPDASQKAQMEDSFSSFSCTSPHRAEPARLTYSDTDNNNANTTDTCCNVAKHRPVSAGSVQARGPLSKDTTTVKVLNLCGDQARKSGAVFAVIAVKSPPRDSAPGRSHSSTHESNMVCARSVPHKKGALSDSQCWKSSLEEDVQPAGFPKHQPKTTRQGDDAKYSECVPLEPLAHEWLVKCAAGRWGQIHVLLLQDARLAQKKDFMSGFTALHWAAKDGNHEMIQKLMDISRKRGTYVNINSRAHGGYTPLHIAAIHGHIKVMVLLVKTYGASASKRDNHGKRAFHYLGKGVPAEVRALLGGRQLSKCREKSEEEAYREHPKSFNTISRLFHPHTGKKQKATTTLVQDW